MNSRLAAASAAANRPANPAARRTKSRGTGGTHRGRARAADQIAAARARLRGGQRRRGARAQAPVRGIAEPARDRQKQPSHAAAGRPGPDRPHEEQEQAETRSRGGDGGWRAGLALLAAHQWCRRRTMPKRRPQTQSTTDASGCHAARGTRASTTAMGTSRAPESPSARTQSGRGPESASEGRRRDMNRPLTRAPAAGARRCGERTRWSDVIGVVGGLYSDLARTLAELGRVGTAAGSVATADGGSASAAQGGGTRGNTGTGPQEARRAGFPGEGSRPGRGTGREAGRACAPGAAGSGTGRSIWHERRPARDLESATPAVGAAAPPRGARRAPGPSARRTRALAAALRVRGRARGEAAGRGGSTCLTCSHRLAVHSPNSTDASAARWGLGGTGAAQGEASAGQSRGGARAGRGSGPLVGGPHRAGVRQQACGRSASRVLRPN